MCRSRTLSNGHLLQRETSWVVRGPGHVAPTFHGECLRSTRSETQTDSNDNKHKMSSLEETSPVEKAKKKKPQKEEKVKKVVEQEQVQEEVA